MYLIAPITLALTLAACGSVEHRVSGQASSTSEVYITLDTSVCDDLYGSERQQCITDLVETIRILADIVQKGGAGNE